MTDIALLVPALNEETAMGRTALVMRHAVDEGIVSRAVVVDGGSDDSTARIALDAGVEVLDVTAILPGLGEVLGKGDSMFRATRAITADWYAFLDADLGNISIEHLRALVRPVGTDGVSFIKGGFVRVDEHGRPRDIPAGRVSELYGRPLLRRVSPRLAALSQPLSGQVVIRGDVARRLGFVTGYGVEIAMLIDVFRELGPDAIVEADMGLINNRHKPDGALEDVRDQVLAGASLRAVTLPDHGIVTHPAVTNRD